MKGPTQPRLMSLLESVTNVAIGYVLAVLTQVLAFPLFGLNASPTDNLLIGGIFTAVSLVRGYVLRRIFAHMHVRKERQRAGA